MSEQDLSNRSEERREYFRIEDEVLLGIRLLTAQDVTHCVDRITERIPDRFTVAANFAVNSRAMARLLHSFSSQSPDAARFMKLMDQKVNHLARLFVLEEVEKGEYPKLNVNISAGGIVFPSLREFAKDDLLEVRLVLYPAMTGILTVARVVYCERLATTADELPWQIAVEYQHIRESDRDLLCSHIMNRETELLRKQRGED